MPRRKGNVPSYIDDEDYAFEEKYDKEGFDSRAPRNAANARERARMRVLSKAFCRLKTTLPWVPADTKLSKLDTLRLAATYIAHLRAVLRDDGNTRSAARSVSLTLSWPFAIQSSSLPILTKDDCETSPIMTTSNSISASVQDCAYKSHQTSYNTQNFYQLNDENQSTRHNYDSHMLHYYNDA